MRGFIKRVDITPDEHDDNIVFNCPICHKSFIQANSADSIVSDKFLGKEELAALILRGAERVSAVRCDRCHGSEAADDIDKDILNRLTEMAKEKEKSRGKKVKRVH
jgi:predicted methyltransferase